MHRRLEASEHRLALSAQRIDSLSPQKKIKQGYAFLAKEDGAPIRHISQVQEGETVQAYVTDGWIKAQVTQTGEDHHD